ncbi:hypothetical protein AVEN_95213-1 [Araneus ventricosus]|uniref:Uncharacterized protein n=1 Tax=Araneus ventricosus TaxID=182803 RepID=A0A4Y2XB34_ARAVE|nr:hypothetical protein AVEN_75182-1 [Araneus ventricosus]GBO46828.1 hypothetical protein AVEN_95213-1 [Araneus ventricosus]
MPICVGETLPPCLADCNATPSYANTILGSFHFPTVTVSQFRGECVPPWVSLRSRGRRVRLVPHGVRLPRPRKGGWSLARSHFPFREGSSPIQKYFRDTLVELGQEFSLAGGCISM